MKNLDLRFTVDDIDLILGKSKNNSILQKVKIINLLYHNRAGLTTQEIVDKLNSEGSIKQISLKTVQDLIKELREQERPWISSPDPEGNKRNYKYKLIQQDRSHASIQYNSETLKDFTEWLPLIETYEYIPFIGDIKKLIENEETSFFRKKIIDFPKTEYLGIENIMDLYKAIKKRHPIEFNYNSYNKNKDKNIIKLLPYIIKEHKGRWYLIGKKDHRSPFSFYALDRINGDIYIKTYETFKRENELPKNSWEDSSGIYLYWKNTDKKDDSEASEEYEPVHISFLLRDGKKYDNVEYLRSKKLHHSQVISQKPVCKKGGFEYYQVKLYMFPDTDLVREIRRIGLNCIEDIKVKWDKKTAPPNLEYWIREG